LLKNILIIVTLYFNIIYNSEHSNCVQKLSIGNHVNKLYTRSQKN